MKNFLENIRSKDDSQKVMIAFVSAIVITLVIVITWITIINLSEKKEVAKETTPKKSEEVTPLSNIGSQVSEIKSMFGNMMAQFNDSKDIIQAIPEIIEEAEVQQENDFENSTSTSAVNSTTTTEIESSDE